jgi:predicted nucleic acid-binding Zn ribbon protein
MTNVKKYDVNRDGDISEDELSEMEKIQEIERDNRKQSAQRRMAWVAIWSMIVFTILLFSPIISNERVSALADLLGLFYIAQAGIVGAFMGVSAWMNKK